MAGEAPIGSVIAFAGPTGNVPAGWMVCDGRALDRNAEPALFQAIGTTWGGDGAPNYFIPDLRGAFLRGVDKDQGGTPSNPVHDPERDVRDSPRAGANPGNNGNNVGSFQIAATMMPHRSFAAEPAGAHSHTYFAVTSTPKNGADEGYYWIVNPGGNNSTSTDGTHVHSITGGDVETRPFNAYVYYIIRTR